jgi:hypothetical protein
MPVQLNPQVQIEWIVAPDDEISAEWPKAECCMPLLAQSDPPPPPLDEDEWWPGRCIP